MSDFRRQALQLAAEILSQQGPPPAVFSVTVRGPGVEITYTSQPGEFATPLQHLTAMQQAVLECFAAGETLTARAVARRSGYSYSSRLRGVLADLCREPLRLLETTAEGYRRRPGPADVSPRE